LAQLFGIFCHIGGDQMILKIPAEFFEPEHAQRGEDPAFIRNAIGHDYVVGADAVGGHD